MMAELLGKKKACLLVDLKVVLLAVSMESCLVAKLAFQAVDSLVASMVVKLDDKKAEKMVLTLVVELGVLLGST